jgi:large subunit ribosomal protein L30
MSNLKDSLETTPKVVRIRQVRGVSGRTKEVVRTVAALGLHGIGTSREVKLNSSTRGMIRRVSQLVVVEPLAQ